MGYFGISGDTSSFFSSFFGGSSTSSTSSVLSDYASIQNGSYKKLLRAYYEKNPVKSGSSTSDGTVTGTDDLKKTAKAATDASALADAAAGLMKRGKDSVFEQEGEEGRKKMTEAVKDFADKYNTLVDSGSDLDYTNILRNTLNMTKMSKANAGVLSDIGITIGDGSKLQVDEEKLSKASVQDLKQIFQGNGSFGSQIMQKAASIKSAATLENVKGSGTYSNTGSYSKNLDVGKLYQELF